MGGSDSDVGTRVVAQLNDLVEGVRGLARPAPQQGMREVLENLSEHLEQSFLPLLKVMHKKIDVDLHSHQRIGDIATRLDELSQMLSNGEVPTLKDSQP